MKLDFKAIVTDSNRIYSTLSQNIKYLYSELQELTSLGDTRLCLALCQLLHDKRIYCLQENNTVYYQLRQRER